ncbi:MAG: hypothetical protein SPH11_07725 [Lentihominibacter sp.]|uniref:hypothetical protein n=1 Tax=Lentihominibacter sp. TaxID=2944216 RepID=UPI002A91D518|nr:hypothetical protein [Lentihominibacter sp.]MDY5287624.1 hypothetical protein [Lentihominibacter sp.]
MEITIKLTDSELEQVTVATAVAQILGTKLAGESTITPVPQNCDCDQHRASEEPADEPKQVEEAPPWEEDVPQMNPPQEQKPDKAADNPDALRSQIRQIGNELTAKGKASKMLEVFKEFGAAKLSAITEQDLPEVLKRLEAL